MSLKRLEIQGFKSFATKTTLHFKPGITIVVGPNGSGKSNIADAIRWVLGEQSVKALRGDKMADVIFAGSEKRRPLGLAEVSLTIDNSSGLFPLEYNEITVTRRLYRSGESDYLINRVPCRLRDIHTLFMDTGIGREGFSLIGQGRIDEVLSVKPEVRRGLLEEAAGIVQYRYRKEEALQKLTETAESLLRVNDLRAELAHDEAPLRQEAAKAKAYQNKKRQLAAGEIGLLLAEYEQSQAQLTQIEEEAALLSAEIELLKTKYHQGQSQEAEIKLALQKKEAAWTMAREKIYEENLALQKNTSEKKLILEKQATLQEQREQLKKEEKELAEKQGVLEKESEAQEIQKTVLLEELQNGEKELAQFSAALVLEKEQEIKEKLALEKLEKQHFTLLEEERQIKEEIIGLAHEQQNLLKREQELSKQVEQSRASEKEAKTKLVSLEKEVKANQTALFNLSKELVAQEEIYGQEKEQLAKQREQNLALRETKNELTTRQKLLQEMEKEGQGYGYGVRKLLQAKDELAGLLGPVAQIIKVPGAYERAMEVVLGGALQNMVTETEKAARQAIAWLKQKEYGRVTFLPLETVRGHSPQGVIPSGEGVIGRCSTLVDYQSDYQGIIEYLLGRTWLVENLAIAVQQGQITKFRWRLVTLEGETVNPGGSLTGGSTKTASPGLLGRRRQIKELAVKIKEVEDNLALAVQKTLVLEKTLEEIAQAGAKTKEAIQKLRLQEVEIKSRQDYWLSELKQAESLLGSLEAEIKQGGLQLADLKKQIAQKKEEQKIVVQKSQVCWTQKTDLEQSREQEEGLRLQKNETLTQLRIVVATAEAKLTAFQQTADYYQAEGAHLTKSLWAKKSALQEIGVKEKELTISLGLVEEKLSTSLQLLQTGEGHLQELREAKVELENELETGTQTLQEVAVKLRQKEEEKQQREITQSKLTTVAQAAAKRLQEQYELTLAEAQAQRIPPEGEQAVFAEIKKLKKELEAFGEVNLGALSEYTRLKERLAFLQLQVEDLSAARQKLEIVIGEMDQIMAEKFEKTYVEVNRAFQDVFARLFGGGQAELILCEPESPLATGVEVKAQPPGKKPQSLALLSGGERALTAIALLLAMLRVRPSPFCLLDEIESTLDEANIGRFTTLLSEFARKTQFIVISHRKGTMEVGDVLYGVTMAETGVSRLVSVKLADAVEVAS